MLREYKNIHEGERVFIVGNGPSLNKTPLEDLQNEFTMGLNKIDLIYSETTWRPSYYVFYDFEVYKDREFPPGLLENVKRNLDTGAPSFISEPGRTYLGERENIEYFKSNSENNTEKRKKAINTKNVNELWSTDITDRIFNFGSTISVAVQIATYMGFDEIYFVGTDLYKVPTPYMLFREGGDPAEYEFTSESLLSRFFEYVSDSSSPIRSTVNIALYKFWLMKNKINMGKIYNFINNRDPNHFSDEYSPNYSRDLRWKNNKLREVHKVIEIASNKHDFEVYNATIGGHLEVHERVSLENILY